MPDLLPPPRRCALLLHVFATAAVDILGFYLMVFQVMVAFGVVFQHLAGAELYSLRNTPQALITMLSLIHI